MALIQITLVVVFLLVLAFSANRVVKSLIGLSDYFGLPKFLISFVVLGLGTSLPDLFISGVSASKGDLQLVLGTVIGANVIVLCIVLGIIAFVKGRLWIREKSILENFGWIFFVLMIPFFLLLDGKLSFFEGVILVVVYLMYLYNVSEHQSLYRPAEGQMRLTEMEGGPLTRRGFSVHLQREILKVVFYFALVLVSSFFVVEFVLQLSSLLSVPTAILGVSLVALGVTLPELALDLTALKAREEEIIWGDLIGSVVTELTLVLGVAGIFAAPQVVIGEVMQWIVPYFFMAICFFLVFFFTFKKKVLTKAEGMALILFYVIFISVQFDLAFFMT